MIREQVCDEERGADAPVHHEDEEETQLAIQHLEARCLSRFTRCVFDPSNPFIAGAAVLWSVVAAQTAYLQSTYTPLPPPARECSCGYIPYEEDGVNASDGLRRVIVLGDSLVLSIGCDEVPVFAESVARGVALTHKTNVSWRSFGIDGGDVSTIRQDSLDDIRAAVECRPPLCPRGQGAACRAEGSLHDARGDGDAAAPSAAGSPRSARRRNMAEHIWRTGETSPNNVPDALANPPSPACSQDGRGASGSGVGLGVDVCMILCGLNDFKRLWKGHTASAFARQLAKLLADLRAILGPQCLLVLPALPMEPTRFPEPLRSFVLFVAEKYDAEKARLVLAENRRDVTAGGAGAVMLYLSKPSVRWWKRVHERHGVVISEDGVHPNEAGYAVYGEWLGSGVSKHLLSSSGLGWASAAGVSDLSGHGSPRLGNSMRARGEDMWGAAWTDRYEDGDEDIQPLLTQEI
jgi:lysophospholipase L1-like esterase